MSTEQNEVTKTDEEEKVKAQEDAKAKAQADEEAKKAEEEAKQAKAKAEEETKMKAKADEEAKKAKAREAELVKKQSAEKIAKMKGKYDEGFQEILNGINKNSLDLTTFQAAIKKVQENNYFKNIRYIKIKHKSQFIHVQQIEVYDTSNTDIAKNNNAEVKSSTIGHEGKNELIVDGDVDPNTPWPCGCHTLNNADEWVQLKLKQKYDILRVVVTNRLDGYESRLNGATLGFYDESSTEPVVEYKLSGARRQTFGYLIGANGKTILHSIASAKHELKNLKQLKTYIKFAKAFDVTCDNN